MLMDGHGNPFDENGNFDNELFELDIIERTIKSFDNSEPPVKTIEIV